MTFVSYNTNEQIKYKIDTSIIRPSQKMKVRCSFTDVNGNVQNVDSR